jgi:transcriptional regulator with XRE-family HTH domain
VKYFYDRKNDSLSITLADRRYDTSEEVWPGVVVDFDSDGRPIALEFAESASSFVDVEALAQDRAVRVIAPERIRSTVDVDGRELRLRREGLGFTQAQLAAALGVSSNTIARWERGEMKIDNPRMLSLAMAALVGARAVTTPPAERSASRKGTGSVARGLQQKPSPGGRPFHAKSSRSIRIPAASARRSAKRK